MNQNYSLIFDDDLTETMAIFATWLNEKEVVTIKDFTAIFVMTMPKDVIKVLRTYGVRTTALKNLFKQHMESVENSDAVEDTVEENVNKSQKAFKLPEQFKGFVKNMNELFKGKKCDISGRYKECKFVWQTIIVTQ